LPSLGEITGPDITAQRDMASANTGERHLALGCHDGACSLRAFFLPAGQAI